MAAIRWGVYTSRVLTMAFGVAEASGRAPDSALGDLPKLKRFSAGRQSSFDPSGGNKEGPNTIELRVIGRNPASTGFFAGIDCYRLTWR